MNIKTVLFTTVLSVHGLVRYLKRERYIKKMNIKSAYLGLASLASMLGNFNNLYTTNFTNDNHAYPQKKGKLQQSIFKLHKKSCSNKYSKRDYENPKN